MPIESRNPATGDLVRSFEPLTAEALTSRISVAAEASRHYSLEPISQRIFWIRRLALLLEDDLEDLAKLMVEEMGKPITAARDEVRKCALACRYYAENAERFLAPERLPTDDKQSYLLWEPLGVVLAIMPWNFPLWQVFRFLAPALTAGNVALLKHASNVPRCALAIEALVRRAGFPRGVCQALLIEARQVESVIADDRVVAVTLTGSEAAGRAVAAQAGWLIKKTVLELGGCDPFIVLPSAELDETVTQAVRARTINNGQSCIAAKRFLVHEKNYEEFERRFVEEMESLRVGNPMLEETDVGPLATAQILDDLQRQVNAAISAGGRILTGGNRIGGPGHYFQPTVIAGLPRTAAVAREETFGPVALLFRVSSVEEAIALANDTPFGLGASCWTKDPDEQQRLSTTLQCGNLFFNSIVASDPRLPFGGVKKSGYGRELSAAGMREFMNAKTVVLASTSSRPHMDEPVHDEPPPPAAPVEQNETDDEDMSTRPSGSLLGLSRRG